MTNYGQPYNPAYGTAPAPACAPYTPPPYTAPAYPLAALTQRFGGALTGADPNPVMDPNAMPAGPPITSMDWWKQTTFNLPRWALAGGALTLTAIAYLWSKGAFEGRRTGGSSARRSHASGDFALDSRGGRRRRSGGSRKRSGGSRTRSRSGGSRKRSGGRRDFMLDMGGFGGGSSRSGSRSGGSRSGSRTGGGRGGRRDFGFDLDFNI